MNILKTKKIRFIVASTVLLPYWLFLSLVMILFPGTAALLLGVPHILGKLFCHLFQDGYRIEKRELKDDFILTFSIVTLPCIAFFEFVNTGKFVL